MNSTGFLTIATSSLQEKPQQREIFARIEDALTQYQHEDVYTEEQSEKVRKRTGDGLPKLFVVSINEDVDALAPRIRDIDPGALIFEPPERNVHWHTGRGTEESHWAYDLINWTTASASNEIPDAAGCRVAVIDTGVDAAHPALRIAQYVDFTNTGLNDQPGHGSHVVGLISGLFTQNEFFGGVSNANISMLKAFSRTKMTNPTPYYNALAHVLAGDFNILNLSNGTGPVEDMHESYMLRRIIGAGTSVVAATGNTGGNQVSYPATIQEVIGVGSCDRYGQNSAFSCYGPTLDVLSPGEKLHSTIPITLGSFGDLTGTSMATPLVSGAVALLISKDQTLTPSQISQIVRTNSQNHPAISSNSGVGVLDVYAMLRAV